jgi:mannose-1-phosphate guanylyltransferase
MNEHNYAVIMAGGIGSRFWPHSRATLPKQFLDILSTGKSLIQDSFDRFSSICVPENIYVVTHEDYVEIVKKQLPLMPIENILVEPTRRNTAPCIAFSCYKIAQKDPLANIVITPADHFISNNQKFVDIVAKALEYAASHDALLTIGIKPTRPDTGYGYIQFKEDETHFCKKVKTFTEKPSLELAKTFVESGEFLWNAGIFIWNVNSILAAMKLHLKEVANLFEEKKEMFNTVGEMNFIESVYAQITNVSIDYGVMEKAENVLVIPADFGWSDVGTWASVYELSQKDYLGNAVNGKNVRMYSGSNNMIVAPKDKLVVIDGLENYCVIDTKDVLMIIPKDKEQEVKNITTDLKRDKLDKYI